MITTRIRFEFAVVKGAWQRQEWSVASLRVGSENVGVRFLILYDLVSAKRTRNQ